MRSCSRDVAALRPGPEDPACVLSFRNPTLASSSCFPPLSWGGLRAKSPCLACSELMPYCRPALGPGSGKSLLSGPYLLSGLLGGSFLLGGCIPGVHTVDLAGAGVVFAVCVDGVGECRPGVTQ